MAEAKRVVKLKERDAVRLRGDSRAVSRNFSLTRHCLQNKSCQVASPEYIGDKTAAFELQNTSRNSACASRRMNNFSKKQKLIVNTVITLLPCGLAPDAFHSHHQSTRFQRVAKMSRGWDQNHVRIVAREREGTQVISALLFKSASFFHAAGANFARFGDQKNRRRAHQLDKNFVLGGPKKVLQKWTDRQCICVPVFATCPLFA